MTKRAAIFYGSITAFYSFSIIKRSKDSEERGLFLSPFCLPERHFLPRLMFVPCAIVVIALELPINSLQHTLCPYGVARLLFATESQ